MLNRVFFILSFWGSVVTTFISGSYFFNKEYKGTIICFIAAVLLQFASIKFRLSWLSEDNIED